MWVGAVFENSYGPVNGLNPIVNIKDMDGPVIVNGDPMTEVGSGFEGVYIYDFTLYDSTKDYIIMCDSVTLSGTYRYTYGFTGEYNDILNSHTTTLSGIESTANDIDIRTVLLRKIETNKLVLQDGSTDNWVLYEDDDTTPLLTFSVRDKDGAAIIQPSNSPSIRYKGT